MDGPGQGREPGPRAHRLEPGKRGGAAAQPQPATAPGARSGQCDRRLGRRGGEAPGVQHQIRQAGDRRRRGLGLQRAQPRTVLVAQPQPHLQRPHRRQAGMHEQPVQRDKVGQLRRGEQIVAAQSHRIGERAVEPPARNDRAVNALRAAQRQRPRRGSILPVEQPSERPGLALHRVGCTVRLPGQAEARLPAAQAGRLQRIQVHRAAPMRLGIDQRQLRLLDADGVQGEPPARTRGGPARHSLRTLPPRRHLPVGVSVRIAPQKQHDVIQSHLVQPHDVAQQRPDPDRRVQVPDPQHRRLGAPRRLAESKPVRLDVRPRQQAQLEPVQRHRPAGASLDPGRDHPLQPARAQPGDAKPLVEQPRAAGGGQQHQRQGERRPGRPPHPVSSAARPAAFPPRSPAP